LVKAIVFDFNGVILNAREHKIDPEMVALIKSLHDFGFSLFLFSNTLKSKMLKFDTEYEFLKYFNKIILTEDTNLPKFIPFAYKNMLRIINQQGNEVVYVDDDKKNLLLGEKFGMKSIKFENAKQLKERLEEIGLIS